MHIPLWQILSALVCLGVMGTVTASIIAIARRKK